MSFERPGQSDYIRELQRLHGKQLAATSEGERLQADADLAEFLRLQATGQTRQWFDARRAASGDRE